jgi:2-oxo-4-hydroxy-4-carboxy--5-ureidoimidazoline (OHCU) decarboxylase
MSIHPTTLPSLSEIRTSADTTPSGPLASTLATLFEPSPVLYSDLVPALKGAQPQSYHELVELAVAAILRWTPEKQAAFVGAHPRIGEVKGLSALSAAEQASKQTPPEVLARLEQLNKAYENKYEGLRYITFVNGRSRKEIMVEMEEKLGVSRESNLAIDAAGNSSATVKMGDDEWLLEVRRAVADVGQIARSRLTVLVGAEDD